MSSAVRLLALACACALLPAQLAWPEPPAELRSVDAAHLAAVPTDATALAVTAVDADALRALARLPKLRWLRATGAGRRVDLAPLAALSHVRALHLADLPLADDDLRPLTRLPMLEELHLGPGSNAAAPALAPLADCPALRRLDLRGGLEDECAGVGARLARIESLEELDLGNAFALPPADAIAIAALPRLRRLGLAQVNGWWPRSRTEPPAWLWSRGVDDAAVAAIARMPKLEELDLTQCVKVTGQGVRALRAATALRRLRLSCVPVRDADLAELPTTLTELDLAQCDQVTGSALARFADLQTLDLGHATAFAPASLADWTCRELRTLTLPAVAGWSAAALTTLREHCPALASLTIDDAAWLDDAAAQQLGRMRTLRDLTLRHAPLTDAALPTFAALPQLAVLRLHACHNLTAKALARARGPALRELDVYACGGMQDGELDAVQRELGIAIATPGGRRLPAAR